MTRAKPTLPVLAAVLAAVFLLGAAALAAPPEPPLLSLSFPGGTASEYVAAVRKAAGELNIVVPAEAAEVAVPPVTLRQVTAAAALNILDGRSSERPGRSVRLSVRHMPKYAEGERQTYQVEAVVRGQKAAGSARVWTVSNLIANEIASEAVLSAVEMALEVVTSDTPLDVRFHEDTGLLIATGDEAQMESIDEVLDRLNDGVAMRRAEIRIEEDAELGRDAAHQIEAMRFEMSRLEMLNGELRRMLESRERELESVKRDLRVAELALQKEQARRGSDRPDS